MAFLSPQLRNGMSTLDSFFLSGKVLARPLAARMPDAPARNVAVADVVPTDMTQSLGMAQQ